jgi:hypothetical protein
MEERLLEIRKKALPILQPYISRLAIFGSFGRQETTARSDLDLLITLKPSHKRPRLGLFKWIEIEEKLEEAFGCDVDLVTEEDLSPYIRPYVEKDKVIIYEER